MRQCCLQLSPGLQPRVRCVDRGVEICCIVYSRPRAQAASSERSRVSSFLSCCWCLYTVVAWTKNLVCYLSCSLPESFSFLLNSFFRLPTGNTGHRKGSYILFTRIFPHSAVRLMCLLAPPLLVVLCSVYKVSVF